MQAVWTAQRFLTLSRSRRGAALARWAKACERGRHKLTSTPHGTFLQVNGPCGYREFNRYCRPDGLRSAADQRWHHQLPQTDASKSNRRSALDLNAAASANSYHLGCSARALSSTSREFDRIDRTSDSKVDDDVSAKQTLHAEAGKRRSDALARLHRMLESPYARLMRLDKPIGSTLLFLPCAWSITVGASSALEALQLYGLFYSGAVLMRGAGCTINDMHDRDFDKQVERTRARPIAAGEISINQAGVLLVAQLSGALCVLLSLNYNSFLVGAPSVLPVLMYPLAKRFTNFPQAVLGLTINWGALLGYTAATNTLAPAAFCFYAAGWCWTMIYDTIYAHQDKYDDKKIGVKSSALALGDRTKPVLSAFVLGKLGFLTYAGMLSDMSNAYYACIGLSSLHSFYQILVTDLDKPSDCLAAFRENAWIGALIWYATIMGRVL